MLHVRLRVLISVRLATVRRRRGMAVTAAGLLLVVLPLALPVGGELC